MSTGEDKDGMLAQFRDVTGAENERAQFYLESSNWNLEVALGSFYENEATDSPEVVNLNPFEQQSPATEAVPMETTGDMDLGSGSHQAPSGTAKSTTTTGAGGK